MVENIKSGTELPTVKKNLVHYFDRLYNDIRYNFYREDLGCKSDEVLFIGNKFMSTVAKAIFYTYPHQEQFKLCGCALPKNPP